MSAVQVNEAHVMASGHGAHWWGMFRGRYEGTGRIKTVTASLGGDLVTVACDSKEDAQWLQEQMVAQGLPKSAVKVVTP